MGSRTLVWTGNAGTTDFATAANWNDASTADAATYAPVADDIIELSGTSTITGNGRVAELIVSNTGTSGDTPGFTLADGTITAGAVNATDLLALGTNETLFTKTLTLSNVGATLGFLSISAGSTLSALDGALNISANGTFNINDRSAGGIINQGAINLGAGTLTLGDGGADGTLANTGGLYMSDGSLTGGQGASMLVGVAGGIGLIDISYGSALTLGGLVDIGAQGGTGSVTATLGAFSATTLDVGADGDGTAQIFAGTFAIGDGRGSALTVGGGAGDSSTYTSTGTLVVDAVVADFNGAVVVGGSGGAGTLTASCQTLTTSSGMKIGSLTSNGWDIAGTGTVSIECAVWKDTGSVTIASGLLDVGIGNSLCRASIVGDLNVGAPLIPSDSIGLEIQPFTMLSVTGTIMLANDQSLGYFATIQDAAVSAAALVLSGHGYTMVVGGGAPPGLDRAYELSVGNLDLAFDTRLLFNAATASVGTSQVATAGHILGTLSLMSDSSMTTAGTLYLGNSQEFYQGSAPSLNVDQSTLTINSSGAALVSDAALTSVEYGGRLAASGSVKLTANSYMSVFDGTITASAPGGTALIIDSSSSFYDAGVVSLQGGATIGGEFSLAAGTLSSTSHVTVSAGGTLSGNGLASSDLTADGIVSASGGTLTITGQILGDGTLSLGEGGALALLGRVANSLTADFATTGTITLGDVAGFHGEIAGWATGDTLDLLNLAATSDSVSGQSLTLYGSTHDKLAVLHFAQPISNSEFSLVQGASGDTVISYHG